jgi:hypothetical protein
VFGVGFSSWLVSLMEIVTHAGPRVRMSPG